MAECRVHAEDFDRITTFLANYRWIFDFKLTRIFQDEVLDNIPCEWKETFINLSFKELAQLPFCKVQTEWPESLKLFIQKCVEYSLPREINALQQNFPKSTPLDMSDVNPEIRRGMSGKKIHEVCHMTSLIDHVTRKAGNNGVVDVGSGLGYLGQVLHCNYGHSILGLEGKQGHTTGADRRNNKFETCQHIQNITCELSQQTQSQQEFLFLILDWFSKLKVKGHHCCHNQTGTRTFEIPNRSGQTDHSETQKDQNNYDKTFETVGDNCVKQTGFAGNLLTGSSPVPEESLYEKGVDTALTALTGSEEMESGRSTTFTVEKKGSDICTCSVTRDGSDFVAKKDDLTLTVNKNHITKNDIRQSSPPCCSESQNLVCDTDSFEEKQFGKMNNTGFEADCKPQICMVGLHCCGDLTPTMLKHFIELDQITSLCCVSCCYHRMHFDERVQLHDNFPMSQLLKTSVAKTRQTHPNFKFSAYCLRLAAQETRARWREQTERDHEFHMQNVAYRGILETCLADERLQLKKNVRKLAHKGDYISFMTYTDAVFKHIHSPADDAPELQKLFYDQMQQKYDQYQERFSLIEPLTALQYLLQPVIESLIYLDRKQWLQEQGLHADIVPVFDELISPRNLALIAWK